MPQTQFSFAGSSAFSITGTPIARNGAVVEAGISANYNGKSSFDITYNSLFASGATVK